MKRFIHIICMALAVFLASSCQTKIEDPSYNITGNWKFTGFVGKDYPDNYHYIQVTNDMIAVYDRYEDLVFTFGYKRAGNTLELSAPFAGEFNTIVVESATYDALAKLGQMSWSCSGGQKYYFGIWDRE